MSDFPNLYESDVRARASARSWARGRAYFERGQASNLVWRAGLLTAEVQGSHYEPYQVRAHFAGGELDDTQCTCPYNMGGDCKHIVAVLLSLIHQPDEIDQRPPLSDLLAPLSREQMSSLITILVEFHPHLVDEIEELLALTASPTFPSPGPTAPATTAPPALDTSLLRRQIRAEVRGSILTGYDHWGEEAWYDSDLGAALEPGLTQVRTHLAAGDAQGALILLEAITAAWQEGIGDLDPYFLEYFEEFAGEFTLELGELWAEAILSAEMDEEVRLSWAETLKDLAESSFGGESLEIAVTAAQQGWEYPPLRAAMDGNITELGTWEGEAPYFADDLARIRLAILERRGEYEAYLNLAQAEGQFMPYLHMLAKQGQSDKAVTEALDFLTQPADLHALARTLAEQGEHGQAIRLARHGLGLAEEQGKAELAAWLRDLATQREEPDLALWAAQQALGYRVSLENYLAVQNAAGEGWETIKGEALALVARGGSAEGKVDVYLYEGMHDEAIAAVERSSWFYNIDKVIEAVNSTHPEWAFRQCQERAEAIMDAGRAKEYDVAAEWVRRGRDILLAAGLDNQWRAYIEKIMDVHRRKYKLMPMLRALA